MVAAEKTGGIMPRKYRRKSVEELRKIFLEHHKKWEAVNNPQGIASGEMRKKWDKRIKVLLTLVRRQRSK